ncbi:hypothetical protein [Tenacibaculum bernardetii]|uniref:hypothetical protein n=1 Tax=Tenacibaculum bernardetii TaxID=3021375 RepID=UPI0023AEB607|nr:hypothetical protein [Tenacibaculum bernardetii]
MKKIITILLISLSSIIYSQEDNTTTAEIKESNITTIVLTVDSIKELKSINWDDVKEVFNENTDNEEKVILGFKVKNNKKDSNLKYKHSFQVEGKLSDLNETIKVVKKTIKILENL